MKKRVILAACLVMPASVMAADFSYDYIDLNYAYTDFDDLDTDAEGGTVGFSWSPGDGLFIGGAYGRQETDDYDIDVDSGTLGVGAYFPLNDSINLDFTVAAAYQGLDTPVGDFDSYGASAGLHLRAWLAPRFELFTGVNYVNLFSGDIPDDDDYVDDWAVNAGLRVYLLDQISISASYGYQFDSEAELIQAGVRFNF